MTQTFVETPKVTAKHLEQLLRSHYLPETKPAGGLFATEIQDPSGTRRADVLWVPMTTTERGRIVGHEIKVTRADVMSELSDPTKADAWLRYCGSFWLVIPHKELIDGLDVPEAWGVMTPPSGRLRRSMTVVKPAQSLKPIDPTPALEIILTWMFYRFADQSRALASAENRALTESARAERNHASLVDLEGQIAGGAGNAFHQVADIVQRLGTDSSTPGYWRDRPSTEQIVDAIRDVTRARRIAKDLRGYAANMLQSLDRSTRPLEEARTALAAMVDDADKELKTL